MEKNDLNFKDTLPITQSSINDQIVPTIDARQLHAALGIGRQFNHWIQENIKACNFQENFDYVLSTENLDVEPGQNWPGSISSNSGIRKDYYLSLFSNWK